MMTFLSRAWKSKTMRSRFRDVWHTMAPRAVCGNGSLCETICSFVFNDTRARVRDYVK